MLQRISTVAAAVAAQFSFAIGWTEQPAPRKEPRSKKVMHITNGKGKEIDLFSWLAKGPDFPSMPKKEEGEPFTEEEVACLRELVLWESLRTLLNGKCTKVFNENMDWLLEEDEESPFSFVVCALEMGVDPAQLRAETLRLVYRNLLDKPKRTKAETDYLQDYVLQRHLDALLTMAESSTRFQTSWEWVLSDDESDSLSFVACARGAGLDPAEFRRQIETMIERIRGRVRRVA